MKIRYIVYAFSLIALSFGSTGQAQERLVSVGSNPVLLSQPKPGTLKTGMSDTLNLPVIDDFSGTSPFPSSAVWTDNLVYVNNSFGVNPPTYGVATFDAIDSTGRIYTTATKDAYLADALTSRPVDLFLPLDTTVYLSFFYQPQGVGDAPEPGDSLIVECYAPDSKRWFRVWAMPGSGLQDFRIAMINITDSRFLQKGFRFRFRNYASLAPAFEPSLKVNADHWNIDYVYLNKGRHFDDIIMTDAAPVQSVGSLLVNYCAMPWEHFKLAGISAVKTSYQTHFNNLSLDRRAISPKLKITPVWGSETGFERVMPVDTLTAGQSKKQNFSFNYGFTSSEKDSALFEVTLDLNQSTPDWIPGNDKITTRQLFADYYAYDDGSSEAGYGLVGEGAKTARLAVRFTNLNAGDSLYAVDYYFNQSFADAGKKFFRLAVWSDDNNKPGSLLYEQAGGVPVYKGINAFQRILLDTAQILAGKYYIGWIQTTADFLNIGFDRQNDHHQEIFYNVTGNWTNSSFEGALMIRPVFANKSRKSGIENTLVPAAGMIIARIYPNPSNTQVTIDCGDQSAIIRITLADMQGRIVTSFLESGPACKIPVSNLPNGIYLISVQSDTGINTRQKLVILHE